MYTGYVVTRPLTTYQICVNIIEMVIIAVNTLNFLSIVIYFNLSLFIVKIK